MHAGVDFGTTLIKVVWRSNESYSFLSVPYSSLDYLISHLRSEGISRVCPSGIRQAQAAKPFGSAGIEVAMLREGYIAQEIKLQAEGVKFLLADSGDRISDFILTSIGTGGSYAAVRGDGEVKHFPIGSSIAGGYMLGQMHSLGIPDYEALADYASSGTPQDLLIKDILSEEAGTFKGNLVIASSGKIDIDSLMADKAAGILSIVAIAAIRDALIFDMVPGFQGFKDIVFIGTPVSRIPRLGQMLADYSITFGKTPHIPERGEFALAMGAYNALEQNQ